MSQPPRATIPDDHCIDLTAIFPTPAEWAATSDALAADLDRLETTADPITSRADLCDRLDRLEAAYGTLQRLELYAKLARWIDTTDDAAADRLRRSRILQARLRSVRDGIARQIASIEPERFDAIVSSIDDYQRYAESLREQARHAPRPDIAAVLAEFKETIELSTDLISAVRSSDFDPPVLERPDGSAATVTPGSVRSELSHADREYRATVYRSYWDAMTQFEHTLTRAFAGTLEAARADAAVRGYASVRDRSLRGRCYPETGVRSQLPEAVHNTMLEAIRGALEPYHHALTYRQNTLGVDALRPWDLEVPLVASSPSIDYETATRHIVEALAPLGEDYVASVRSFLADCRIDVYPTREKRTDIPAVCPSSAADGPFILANFRDDVRTMFYICHELGHAMHVRHDQAAPVRYATCPRPFEEVPSLLHEILLAEHLQDQDGPLAAAAASRLLECLGGNLYGSAMNAAFVHRAAGTVEAGEELSPRRARESWGELLTEFTAPVAYDDRAGRTWLGRGWRDPYANYQYVLGATGALAVREAIRADTMPVDEYRAVLETTGRTDAVVLFDRLGCDVTTAAPYERAAAAFEHHVESITAE